jgi:hypothetical protein
MKSTFIVFTLLGLFSGSILAQQSANSSESLDRTTKEFVLDSIRVDGEVESPISVSLRQLPLRSVTVRELGVDSAGNQRFKGAFSYSGYSLYDILSPINVTKKNQKEFSSPVDLYFLVANGKGEQAVFSWGEIFYSRDNFRILISKSVTSINPAKLKTHWSLPEAPRLICAGDLSNVRYVDNPTKVIVRSYSGTFPPGSKENIYSATVAVVSDKGTTTLDGIDPSIYPRKFTLAGYGHGMGYKGVSTIEGYPLKEVFRLEPGRDNLRNAIAVVSAKDGYRTVFSVSEIWDRNNMDDLLLVDRKDSKTDGRYTLFVPSDFFLDRNVKAVDRIQIVNVRSD